MNNNDEPDGNEENEQAVNPAEIDIILELAGLNENMFWRNDEEELVDNEVDIPVEERDHFDTLATSSHYYLHASELQAEQYQIDESEDLQVPVINQDIVVLPGQTVPLQTISPSDRQSIRLALDSKCYLALQTQLQPNVLHHNLNANEQLSVCGKIGILLLLKQVTDDGIQIKAVTLGKERCRFLEFDRGLAGVQMATVKILSGFTMPPLEDMVCPNSLRKLTPKSKSRVIKRIISTPCTALPMVSLKRHCDSLSNWMKLWHTEEQINAELKQGMEDFSFWVAKNIPCSLNAKYEYLEEECTNRRVLSLLKLAESVTLLACSSCNTTISKVENIIKMSIDSISSHFVNNGGYIHEMFTVSEAERFNYIGRPSSEYSWFPGYKWQILECSMCNQHLGWEFTSKRLLPAKFFGLTRKSVIPQVEPLRDEILS